MKACILLWYLLVLCKGSVYNNYEPEVKSQRFTNGVEFDKISRGTLLKILAAFEESIKGRLSNTKMKPVFTAQFANNKYSKPYIYPNVFVKPKLVN